MAIYGWTLLEMSGNGCNGWKCLEMAGNDWKWMEWLGYTGMAEMAGCGWIQLDIIGNGQTWLEIAGMAGNNWKWLELAGTGLKWMLDNQSFDCVLYTSHAQLCVTG